PVGGTVNPRGNRLDLVPQGKIIVVDKAKSIVRSVDDAHDLAREILRAFPALGPVLSHHDRGALSLHAPPDQRQLGISIVIKMVDANYARQPVYLAHIAH